MSLGFRPLSLDDLDVVVAMDAATDVHPWQLKNYMESIDAGYSSWLLIEAGEVAGFAVLLRVLDEAHLLKLTIAPARQRRGLGLHLLENLCARARDAGATQMFLEVRSGNVAARALYARQAFVEIGQRKAYYPCAAGREDAIVMKRELA